MKWLNKPFSSYAAQLESMRPTIQTSSTFSSYNIVWLWHFLAIFSRPQINTDSICVVLLSRNRRLQSMMEDQLWATNECISLTSFCTSELHHRCKKTSMGVEGEKLQFTWWWVGPLQHPETWEVLINPELMKQNTFSNMSFLHPDDKMKALFSRRGKPWGEKY